MMEKLITIYKNGTSKIVPENLVSIYSNIGWTTEEPKKPIRKVVEKEDK